MEKKLTASFFVKSSVTGTYWMVTLKVTIGLEVKDQNNVQTFTINSANTWEYKTVTYNGDTAQSIDNDNTHKLIASIFVCFADIDGYQKVGVYKGNDNAETSSTNIKKNW